MLPSVDALSLGGLLDVVFLAIARCFGDLLLLVVSAV
jgi:hypothetical protein